MVRDFKKSIQSVLKCHVVLATFLRAGLNGPVTAMCLLANAFYPRDLRRGFPFVCQVNPYITRFKSTTLCFSLQMFVLGK